MRSIVVDVLGPSVKWEQVRELARQIDAAAARHEATAFDAARLARLVLDFDAGITGTPVRSTKPSGQPPPKTG